MITEIQLDGDTNPLESKEVNIFAIFARNVKKYLEGDNNASDASDFTNEISDLLKSKDKVRLENFADITQKKENFNKLFDEEIPDLSKIKENFKLLLKSYHQYFSKIDKYGANDSSFEEHSELLKSLNGGNLTKRVDELTAQDLAKFKNISKNITFLFNKLIFEFEKSPDDEKQKAKKNLFLTLQQFPGHETFVCLDGVSGGVVNAIQSTSNQIFDKIFSEKKDLNTSKIAGLGKKDTEIHAPAFLVRAFHPTLSDEEIAKLDQIDQFNKLHHHEINLKDVFSMLKEFKRENFFMELFKEYEDFYQKFSEFDNGNFFKNFKMDEIYDSPEYLDAQRIMFLEIHHNLSSKFSPLEVSKLGLQDSSFFCDDEQKLITPKEFKDKLLGKIDKEFATLYPQYYQEDSLDFFKFLPTEIDLFDDQKPNCLDQKKMKNLLNLFEVDPSPAHEGLKKENLEKIASGLFALKLIASNQSYLGLQYDASHKIFEPIFYFEFFKKFQEEYKVSFFDYFFDENSEIKSQYKTQELSPLLNFFAQEKTNIEEKTAIVDNYLRSDDPNFNIKKAIDDQDLDNLKLVFKDKTGEEVNRFFKSFSSSNALYNPQIITSLLSPFPEKNYDNIKQTFFSMEAESIFFKALEKKKFKVANEIFDFFYQKKTLKISDFEDIIKFATAFGHHDLTNKILTNFEDSLQTDEEKKEFLKTLLKIESIDNPNNCLNYLIIYNDQPNFEKVLEILKKNIDLDKPNIDKDINSAINIAINNNKDGILKTILDKFPPKIDDLKSYMPDACRVGNLKIVKLLADKCHHLEGKYPDISSNLKLAFDYGHADIAEFIFEKSSKSNKSLLRSLGRYSIHEACEKDNLAMAKLLIDKGCKIDKCNASLKTPLILAVENRNFEMAKLLIENGANINAVNIHDKTSLHLACELGDLKMAKLLLDNGANVNKTFISSETPLELAIKKNSAESTEIAKLLIKDHELNRKYTFCCVPLFFKKNPYEDSLKIACKKNNATIVELLLTKFPNNHITLSENEDERKEQIKNFMENFGKTQQNPSFSVNARLVIHQDGSNLSR